MSSQHLVGRVDVAMGVGVDGRRSQAGCPQTQEGHARRKGVAHRTWKRESGEIESVCVR